MDKPIQNKGPTVIWTNANVSEPQEVGLKHFEVGVNIEKV